MTTPTPNDFIDYTEWPFNAALTIKEGIKTLFGLTDNSVFLRALRNTDPAVSIGIIPVSWEPIENEIGQIESTLSRYPCVIQSMIKHADESDGLVAHAMLSKRIRRMVDTVNPVSVALGQLSVDRADSIERMLRWQIQRQQFLVNTLDETFIYLAALNITIDTETAAK